MHGRLLAHGDVLVVITYRIEDLQCVGFYTVCEDVVEVLCDGLYAKPAIVLPSHYTGWRPGPPLNS